MYHVFVSVQKFNMRKTTLFRPGKYKNNAFYIIPYFCE